MKIILCGYHWTGCKALELLLQEGHEVFVYTHRTENYIADLEGLCIKKHISYTLGKISTDNLPFIPDIICSIYYRYLISQDVIDIVKGRIFNLHPALLPKYRGCSSLTWAMINGEEECGFTYHYIDANCDTGKIIIQKAIKIEDFDTQLTLYNRVMFESMKFFLDALDLVDKGYEGKEQEGIATWYKRGCPMEGKITDTMDRAMQERFIRAMCYPPYQAALYCEQEVRTLREWQEIHEVFGRGGGKIVVYGCGGHARSIVNTICEVWEDIDIIMVDKNAKVEESILSCYVKSEYALQENDNYIIAIGDNKKRKILYQQFIKEGKGHCVSLVSLYSNIGIETRIGKGTFVAPNVYIGPQVEIGNNTIVNTGSIIEHEVHIGDHTHIAPGVTICGRTSIGNNVFCGAGSTIIDNIHICDKVTIGAGTVIKEDIVEAGTYAGVPARKID